MVLILILSSFIVRAQSDDYLSEVKAYQDTLNSEFKNPDKSPLKQEDLVRFDGLEFFPVDSSYRVFAKLERTIDSKPFKMKTTTARTATYSKYGDLIFELNGATHTLQLYQNHDLMKTEEYKDYLFLPFLDETNGDGSYGGGRYIGLTIPTGNTIEVDFNKAYNPYCAYNDKYSCPIVPRKNRLKTRVEAGVRAFKKD